MCQAQSGGEVAEEHVTVTVGGKCLECAPVHCQSIFDLIRFLSPSNQKLFQRNLLGKWKQVYIFNFYIYLNLLLYIALLWDVVCIYRIKTQMCVNRGARDLSVFQVDHTIGPELFSIQRALTPTKTSRPKCNVKRPARSLYNTSGNAWTTLNYHATQALTAALFDSMPSGNPTPVIIVVRLEIRTAMIHKFCTYLCVDRADHRSRRVDHRSRLYRQTLAAAQAMKFV